MPSLSHFLSPSWTAVSTTSALPCSFPSQGHSRGWATLSASSLDTHPLPLPSCPPHSSRRAPLRVFRNTHLTRSPLWSLYCLQVASWWDKDQNTHVATVTCAVCCQPTSPQVPSPLAAQPPGLCFSSSYAPCCPHCLCLCKLFALPWTPSHPHTLLAGYLQSRSVFLAEHLPYSMNHPVTALNISIVLYLFI